MEYQKYLNSPILPSRSLRTQSAGAGAGWTKLEGAGGGTGISPPGPTFPRPDAALLSRSSYSFVTINYLSLL